MTKLLEHAVDSVRALPTEVQDELARLLLQMAGEEQPVIQLTARNAPTLPKQMRRSRGASSPRTNRSARCWRSAPCEVARHQTRGDADREGAGHHRGGIALGRKPHARADSAPFLLLAQHPHAGQATDLPGVRRLPVSPPIPT
jgi:hypothetical protein